MNIGKNLPIKKAEDALPVLGSYYIHFYYTADALASRFGKPTIISNYNNKTIYIYKFQTEDGQFITLMAIQRNEESSLPECIEECFPWFINANSKDLLLKFIDYLKEDENTKSTMDSPFVQLIGGNVEPEQVTKRVIALIRGIINQ